MYLHVICTWLCANLLNVYVGDSLWVSDEIVENQELHLSVPLFYCCFYCYSHYCYIYIYKINL